MSPEGFAAKLDADLNGVLDDLVATYVHGSVALGGFVAGRSDVDVLVVAEQAHGGDISPPSLRSCTRWPSMHPASASS